MRKYEIVLLAFKVFLLISSVFATRYLFTKITLEWNIRIKNRNLRINVYEVAKKYRGWIWIIGIVICMSVVLFWGMDYISRYIGGDEKWECPLTIAHAGGEIDGFEYSNCKEAVLENYKKGQRTFEIDFTITSDGALVAKHDWDMVVQDGVEAGYAPTKEEFLSVPIYGKYTPMALEDICQLMEEYPDIWIVTDIKDANTEEMKRAIEVLVQSVNDIDKEDVLDRFVIQVYSEDIFKRVEKIYPFKNWIFTLYQCWDGNQETFPEYVRFCYRNGIDTITMWDSWVDPQIIEMAQEYEIDICVHTVNDAERAQEYIDMGVAAVYTDTVMPDELRRN